MKCPARMAVQTVDDCSVPIACAVKQIPERNQHLRDEGDDQRTARIARPLKPARVGKRDSDEEARDAQVAQQARGRC